MACHLHTNKLGDFSLLVIRSQIANLTPNPSFGHNLCFKYLNESCDPILGIYIFNPMSFNPHNCLLKIQESIKIPTHKVGIDLGVWGFIPSHSPTLLGIWNVTLRLHSWLAPSQALTLVASPRLGLRHSPSLEKEVNVLIDILKLFP